MMSQQLHVINNYGLTTINDDSVYILFTNYWLINQYEPPSSIIEQLISGGKTIINDWFSISNLVYQSHQLDWLWPTKWTMNHDQYQLFHA